MSETRYIKAVRTWYRKVLEEEIEEAALLREIDILSCDKEKLIADVNKSIKKMEVYCEKLEVQSKTLCQAMGDTDDEMLSLILDEDGKLSEIVTTCCIELEEFKHNILETKVKADVKPDQNINVEYLVQLQTEMQKMVINQMKQQQKFFEKQDIIRSNATASKLPKLELASFDGDKMKWTEFWDAFESTVHRNKNLSNIEKMNYLRSKLSGDAKGAISGLTLSNDNYVIAIQTLRDRFGKAQEVIDLHYSKVINLPTAQDTTSGLRSFLDTVEKHLRSLEVLNQDVHQAVFVSMIKSKLPNKVHVDLEMQKDTEKSWTLDLLRNRLRHYVDALEAAQVNPSK